MGYAFSTTSLRSDANLKAYYKLEDESDETGAYDLTNTGSTPFNAALYDNGSDHGASNSSKYLTISNNMGITGGAITMAGWFKLYAANATQTLIMQGNGTTYVSYFLYWDGGNTFGFGTDKLVANRQRQLAANNCVPSASLSPGTSNFFHAALTYDTTTLTLYYNGEITGTPTAYSGNGGGAATDKVQIGFNNGQSGNIYGSIIADDCVIFDRALDETEIAEIYNGVAPVVATTNYLKARGRNRLETRGVSLV